MGLPIGSHIGPYQIVSTLGAGGMGEVYRARDSRLGRDVAIKALPESLAGDAERVARFWREAQILASLNHPHIAAIHGLEEVSGSQFLVLELVEGDTLARLVDKRPLPVPEALRLARQIADALHAAHGKNVVHRDLKPANIALTAEGRVKVLDFGLAKSLEPTPSDGDASHSPTLTGAGTRIGTVVGTAAYMSPEQARGLPIDKRTDIWSFGCVLYEMLTGRRAFPGRTTSDAIAGVLEHEPDWRLLPAATSPRIRWLLHRCFAKDPDQRLHDMADARIEIDEALKDPAGRTESAAPSASVATTRERVAWGVAAICLLGLIAALAMRRGGAGDQTAAEVATYSTSIVLPDGVNLSGPPPGRFALSPDGQRLAVVASDSTGRSQLYIRRLDRRIAQPLGGTDDASFPFWSPDSRFVAFIAEKKLKKINVSDGEVVTICDAGFAATGTWSSSDVILFTPSGNAPLFRVSAAASGTPTAATTLDEPSGDVQHSYPFFLPDGRRFLYFVVGGKGGRTVPRGVYAGSLDSKDPGKLILENAANPKYANGHLLFLRAGTLLAQRFDVERLELQGDPVPLGEQIQVAGRSASEVTGAFTISQTGMLVFQTASRVRSQLIWFDRKGTRLGTLGEQDDYVDVALSPDDSHVATSILDDDRLTRDLWIFDVARGLGERSTFAAGDDFAPNWSPRGDRIVFSSLREGSIHLYEKAASGAGSETLLLEDELGKFNAHASSDGRFLVYVAGGGIIGRSDIWMLPRADPKKASPLVETTFIESQPQFSPDGRWVAFMTNKSGRQEVYVTQFPGHESETRVTAAGGSLPRWNRNGREMFYVAPDGVLTATAVDGRTSRFEVGASRALFPIRTRPSRLDAFPYDVTSDGERILVNEFVDEVMPPMTLIVNWTGAK